MKIHYLTLTALIAFSLTAQAEEQKKPAQEKEPDYLNEAIAIGAGTFAVGSGIERYRVGQEWKRDYIDAELKRSETGALRQQYLRQANPKLAKEIDAIRQYIHETRVMPADKMTQLENRLGRLDAAMEAASKNDPEIIKYNDKLAAQEKIVKSLERVDIGSQYIKALPGDYRVRANRAVLKGALGAGAAIVAGEKAINHLYSDETIQNRPALQEPEAADESEQKELNAELP